MTTDVEVEHAKWFGNPPPERSLTMTLYPTGYGTRMVTMEELRRVREPRMHPEMARRLFHFIEAQGGKFGIGGGFRSTGSQPDKPGFAKEGRSFHQYQTFPSGRFYVACDMVVVNPGHKHRAPRWSEVPQQGSDAARRYGVHMNVGEPGSKGAEPWHIQPVEVDGYDNWVRRGRPDLQYGYPLDGAPPAPPQPPVGQLPATVRRGDNNCTVALLQQKLGIHVDGDFGPQTDRAVRDFQGAHGLYVDGIVGPKTWAVIG